MKPPPVIQQPPSVGGTQSPPDVSLSSTHAPHAAACVPGAHSGVEVQMRLPLSSFVQFQLLPPPPEPEPPLDELAPPLLDELAPPLEELELVPSVVPPFFVWPGTSQFDFVQSVPVSPDDEDVAPEVPPDEDEDVAPEVPPDEDEEVPLIVVPSLVPPLEPSPEPPPEPLQ
jgi:hypothetical protein